MARPAIGRSRGNGGRNTRKPMTLYPFLKRFIDVLVSLVILILSFPILLVVALLILISMGRPILFRQVRPGLGRRPFVLYKFRTMTDAVDKGGAPLPDEFRLTRLGRLLRRLSIDELPQMINVLKGDLSLVGPRPLLVEYLPYYTARQNRRHDVPPGITGWAQVNGRNALSWEDKLACDVWYVDHRSLRLDIIILYLTAKNVITGRGVKQVEGVSITPFGDTPPPPASPGKGRGR